SRKSRSRTTLGSPGGNVGEACRWLASSTRRRCPRPRSNAWRMPPATEGLRREEVDRPQAAHHTARQPLRRRRPRRQRLLPSALGGHSGVTAFRLRKHASVVLVKGKRASLRTASSGPVIHEQLLRGSPRTRHELPQIIL